MAFYKVLCILLVFSVSALTSVLAEDRALEAVERQLKARRGRTIIIECRKLDQNCLGIFAPCCGNLHCYWEKELSLIKDGYCVRCIKRGQVCQANCACCSDFVCHKVRYWDVNGCCDDQRDKGLPCQDDSQCYSNSCNISPLSKALGQEGKCY